MGALNLLKAQIDAVKPLEEATWAEFSALWSPVLVKRKEMLTKAGETERYLYFVVEGIQRAYAVHEEREATIVFSYAPSFSGIIDSFFTQSPSGYNLEALTQSSLLRIHYNDMARLMEKHKDMEVWVRIAMASALAGVLQRQKELMCYTAEEKFRALLKRSPHVLNLIPHKYLASYINVDPATFSKLLSSVRL